MPTFKELPSSNFNGDLAIKVIFANFEEDILVLSQVPGTSIYEGHLQDDYEVPVVLIDTPLTRKRLVSSIYSNDIYFEQYNLFFYGMNIANTSFYQIDCSK